MDKLIVRLPNILIGLSILVFSGCRLTEIDPPEKYYFEKYLNSSNKEVTIVLKNSNTSSIAKSFTISKGNEENGLYSGIAFTGGNKPIENYVDNLLYANINKIELYVEDLLVKEWGTPIGNFGSDINNPFNYDSWKLEELEATENNVVGKIIFTITDHDIE